MKGRTEAWTARGKERREEASGGGIERGREGAREGGKQCLSQDLDFFQKRSYLNFLGSYLQKRGVIHQGRKLRDEARK